MKNEFNYYVIGGQYESVCYGGAKTELGAKRLATEKKEYWDNWQGWHTPKIYKSEDTKEIESRGRMTTFDGQKIRIATGDPYLVWDRDLKKWKEYEAYPY